MALRSGQNYLTSLRDGRVFHMDGSRVEDVASDPRLAGAARTVASLFDMQTDPAVTTQMTYTSPSSGEPVGLSHIEPADREELELRRGACSVWMQATKGMFGRSPDFMNVFMSSLGSAASFFGADGPQFAANARRFADDVREQDLVMTHTLVNPQVDRSKTVDKQDVDLACRIVRETDAGIVVSGARMVSTLAAYADEIVVLPSSYIANTPEAKDYAFGFGIPIATPGLSFLCRPSLVPQGRVSLLDHPLSMRLDETDAVVVFKDVLVPWERVFIHRSPALCNRLYPDTQVGSHTSHQAAIKALAKTEFMLGLALSLVRSTKIDGFLHVQGMLAEIMLSRETIKSCITAAEAEAKPTGFDTVAPSAMPLWVIRLGFPRMFHRMQEIIQLLGAGGLVASPSFSEFSGEAADAVAEYLQSASQGAVDRVRLCRLAFDASVSGFAGRQQLYERYYTGDPVRLAGTLVNLYPDKDALLGRIDDLIESLSVQSRDPIFAPAPDTFESIEAARGPSAGCGVSAGGPPGRPMLVYDQRAAYRGRRLNAMFLALRCPADRAAFKVDPSATYDRFGLTTDERALVEASDWDGLMQAGLSIYALGKGLPALGSDLLEVGADLHGLDRESFMAAQRHARAGG